MTATSSPEMRPCPFCGCDKADITIAAVEVPACESENLGVLEVDEGQCVLDFKEKPRQSPSIPGRPGRIYASMGIYIFKKDVLLEELLQFDSFGKQRGVGFTEPSSHQVLGVSGHRDGRE